MPNRTLNVILSATDTTLSSTLRRSATEVQSFSSTVNGASQRVVSSTDLIGKSFLVVGGIMAAALVIGVKSAVELEAAMRNVATISPFVRQNIEGVTNAVVEMSTRLPQSATELARGLYNVASSGFAGKESMVVLDASARAASAGLSDTATAGKAITGVLNAYGLEAADARKVSDVLFQTVNLGVVTFEELAQQIGDVLGIASTAKIPIEEVGAAVAQITRAGIPAAEATTALNRTIQNIIDPSESLNVVLHNLGYETGAQALESDGLQKVLLRVKDAIGGNVTSWLQLFPEIRAARGALALTSGEGRGWIQILKQMDDATKGAGATQRALNQQQQSFAFQWQITKNQINAVLLDIGEELIPVLKTAAVVLRAFVDGWEALPKPLRSALIIMALVAGSLRLLTPLMERFFLQMSLAGAQAGMSTTGIRAAHTALSTLGAALPRIVGGLSLLAIGFTQAGEGGVQGAAGIASMAAGGAMIGSTFGIWGTVIGGAVGATVGLGLALNESGESAEDFRKRIHGLVLEVMSLSTLDTKGPRVAFFANIGTSGTTIAADIHRASQTIGQAQRELGLDASTASLQIDVARKKVQGYAEQLQETARQSPAAANRIVDSLTLMQKKGGEPFFDTKDIVSFYQAVDRGTEASERLKNKRVEHKRAAIEAALADLNAAGAMDEVKNSAQAAALAIKDVTDAQVKQQGGQLALDQALLDAVEAQRDYDTAVREHGVFSEEARAADVKRQQAALDIVAADHSLTQSTDALLARYRAVPGELDAQIAKYQELKAQHPELAASFDPIIARLLAMKSTIETTPKNIPITTTLTGAEQVISGLNEIRFAAGLAVGAAANAVLNFGGPGGPRITGIANGGVVKPYASGGIERGTPMIGNGRRSIMWNEPETGGESYIPWGAAKRMNAMRVLRTTASAFGQAVVPMANGGFFGVGGGHPMSGAGVTLVVQGNVYGDSAFKQMMKTEVDKRNRHSGIALARKGR